MEIEVGKRRANQAESELIHLMKSHYDYGMQINELKNMIEEYKNRNGELKK